MMLIPLLVLIPLLALIPLLVLIPVQIRPALLTPTAPLREGWQSADSWSWMTIDNRLQICKVSLDMFSFQDNHYATCPCIQIWKNEAFTRTGSGSISASRTDMKYRKQSTAHDTCQCHQSHHSVSQSFPQNRITGLWVVTFNMRHFESLILL